MYKVYELLDNLSGYTVRRKRFERYIILASVGHSLSECGLN